MDFTKLRSYTFYYFTGLTMQDIKEIRDTFDDYCKFTNYGVFKHKSTDKATLSYAITRQELLNAYSGIKIIHITWKDFKNLCGNSNSFKRRYIRL